jgi:transcriptional regulator
LSKDIIRATIDGVKFHGTARRMYQPPSFREHDRENLFELIERNGFGLLVSNGALGPRITHIPFLLDRFSGERGVLGSHMARNNDHWQSISDGDPVVAVFPGPHAYVTPQWYREEPDVPTWNYRAVHVHGRFRHVTDPAAVRAHLEALVKYHEARYPGAPIALGEMDEAMVAGFIGQLAAFEIDIERVEGAAKLSQDKLPADRERVAAGLRVRASGDDTEIASEIELRPSARAP